MTDLAITRGDDATFELTIRDAAGAALNLTGATLWFTVKRSHRHPDIEAVLQKQIGAGITVVNAAAGRADVKIDAANTAGLTPVPVNLVWDCQIKEAGGKVSTVDRGRFSVEPDVTIATT